MDRQAGIEATAQRHDPPQGTESALAEWIERAAVADLLAAVPAELQGSAGLFVHRAEGLCAFGAPGVPSLMFNRVFVDAEAGLASYASVPRVLEALRARGVADALVHAHLDARDAHDPRVLALHAAGLQPFRRAWLKLARDAQPVEERGAALPLGVCRTDEAEGFAELVTRGLQLAQATAPLVSAIVQRPRWHVYVARDAGQVVASGALFVQGDVGHLGFAATLPSYRGLGLQRALIARRLRVAYALGCRLVTSETGEAVPGQPNPSEHNLRALGLRVIALRSNWTRPDAPWG